MLHAAYEGRAPVLVACTPPFPAEPPTNEFFVFTVEKGPPRKCSRFSGADRFSPCRLHAAIYEPIVYYLGIAGGIVKRAKPSALKSAPLRRRRSVPRPPCAKAALSTEATKRRSPGKSLGRIPGLQVWVCVRESESSARYALSTTGRL